METVESEQRSDPDDTVTKRAPATQVELDARTDADQLSPSDADGLDALPVLRTDVPRAGSRTPGTPHDPDPRRAARVSAAKALVMVRRRTGKAIPADVLALAAED